MDKFNLSVSILAGVALVGVIVLVAFDKTVDVLLPILTTLVGILVGSNKEQVVGYFTKK
jgi:hypothetical protein